MRVEIKGGWVEYREPSEVPERLRRKVVNMASRAAGLANRLQTIDVDNAESIVELNEADMEFLSSFNDAVAICLVSAWSFDPPLTVEGLGDLPSHAYDSIVGWCRDKVGLMMPSFAVDADPKALTGN
jgi:hypothetical protein